jgi:aminomethyltransferase
VKVLTAESELKRTPMHAAHVAAGGRMVAFGGWHMPVQYSGLIEEHVTVRERVGLFDVSHMGEVSVRGPQALDYLQYLTSNNVARLEPGRAHYTGLMTPSGCFVDDMLIYQLDRDDYLVVINAANIDKDVAWFLKHAPAFDVRVENVSDQWAQLAVQGPAAAPVVAALTEVDVDDIRYYGFVRASVAGVEAILSRTGYTGEDGFEIYAPAESGERLWHAVLRAGEPRGIAPIGLGARDTLRLEARMALYGNDIDETTTAYEADLGWIVKLKKGEFVGREALVEQKRRGLERKLVGFEMRSRAIARHGYDAVVAGGRPGRVTSGSFAPFLRKNIGLAYLPIEATEIGTEFEIEIRGRRESAVVVPTPFYKRA